MAPAIIIQRHLASCCRRRCDALKKGDAEIIATEPPPNRINRIELPTPLPVGPVNAYLVAREPPILVDAGPRTRDALTMLTKRLNSFGIELDGIDTIIITHAHVDHFGLAKIIHERSGCQLLAHSADAEMIERFQELFWKRTEAFDHLMKKCGTPQQERQSAGAFFGPLSRLGEEAPITRRLQEEDKISLENDELEVIHCPGHSEGSASLYDSRTRLLFAGDSLLENITPYIGVLDVESHDTPLPLELYLHTLRKLASLRIDKVYPGHGEVFHDIERRTSDILRHHEERKMKILACLTSGECTPYEVSLRLFGSLPAHEVLLGLTEALSHLQILEKEGKVRKEWHDDKIRYANSRKH